MSEPFDKSLAKETLEKKEIELKRRFEEERVVILERTLSFLKKYFSEQNVEVFLVGSITVPGKFTPSSDIDIVLKHFYGDRFEIWGELERALQREVEIILYENCGLKEFVEKEGLRVI